MPETRRCLIIGGCGFIGSHLAGFLHDRGDDVIVFDNLTSGWMDNLLFAAHDIPIVKGDISMRKQLSNCFSSFHPQYVFNLAATNLLGSLKNPYRDLNTTAIGTLNVLELSRKSRSLERVVYASSGSVYGESKYSPQDEKHPLQPNSPYGATKMLAEKYHDVWHRLYRVSFSALRLYNVYGPRQDYSRQGGVIPIFVSRMLRNKPPLIEGTGKQKRCFTYVEDVVRAFSLASEHPKADGLTFNVASKEVCTVLELVRKLNLIMGTDLEPTFGPPRLGDIMDFRPDISLAERRLGYRPRVRLEEGLSHTIEWLRSVRHRETSRRGKRRAS